jgi:hypothetical protein
MSCFYSGRFQCRLGGGTNLVTDLPLVAYTLSISIVTSLVALQNTTVKRPRDIIQSLIPRSVENTVWKSQARNHIQLRW